ncbi:SMI1/KNR4 family protein [Sphingomonas cavernae]|uniref:SMI1/KNR4 family protein n=1 Tax=Sphingomonas cavernae TaxID=2320861 RepID=A0A418W5U8_9SPHN|nr:SMI1/KNR4 family protein [Sphingomonas cavernae]RJF85318.1 SMI1/KNR4 family protein [Sphingomonas cavernae]
MSTAREYFERLCRSGAVSGPVDDGVIAQAEAELDVQFPSEYRDLLENYGAVLAGGVEVYGLPRAEINDPPLWQNVVSVTKQLRKWGQAGSDRVDFVPICDDGGGVYFYLDTSVSPKTRICAVGPGVDKVLTTTALFQFFVDLSEGKVVV